MQEVEINGRKRLCFLVTEGDSAKIVIPVDILAPIDYQRLRSLEARGGELMSVMRDTRLDNGMNALVQYQNLLVVVPKEKPVKKAAEVDVKQDDVKPVDAPPTETEVVKEAPRRGRRPKNG